MSFLLGIWFGPPTRWAFRPILKLWHWVSRLGNMMIGWERFLMECSQVRGGYRQYLRAVASSCSMWKQAEYSQHLKGHRVVSFLRIARCGPCTALTAQSKYGTFRPGAGFGKSYCGQFLVYSPPQSRIHG